MSWDKSYLDKTFFRVEKVPKVVGTDFNGKPLYTGDEVFVVGTKKIKTNTRNKEAKYIAVTLGAEVKVLGDFDDVNDPM
ncbi:hypothetical protein WS105_0648 [Weissella ceti]|uniref:hypothetical protein n=1 Tax=Weissella ceti TaxID=759620 RepID=UPI0004F60D75|nr:hypothetical protein [Weissella ceti]AIM64238.1 hypothetical protein WS105_0648 [Weissella ceti]